MPGNIKIMLAVQAGVKTDRHSACGVYIQPGPRAPPFLRQLGAPWRPCAKDHPHLALAPRSAMPGETRVVGVPKDVDLDAHCAGGNCIESPPDTGRPTSECERRGHALLPAMPPGGCRQATGNQDFAQGPEALTSRTRRQIKVIGPKWRPSIRINCLAVHRHRNRFGGRHPRILRGAMSQSFLPNALTATGPVLPLCEEGAVIGACNNRQPIPDFGVSGVDMERASATPLPFPFLRRLA